MTKYKAKKAMVGGIKFDSQREAARYTELLLLQKAGHITGLTLQVPFVLAPAVRLDGETRNKPAIRYLVDFLYTDVKLGKIICEDVKGFVTPAFRMKQHLMATVHGIQVRVTR